MGRSQPPYPSTDGLLTPAELLAFGDTDALDTFDLLVGHKRHTGVIEIQAGRNLRFLAGPLELGDRLDTKLGHLHGVLLRGGPNGAVFDELQTRIAAAVNRHDEGLHTG